MKMFRKSDEGFTLVELMVVVLIIGILVAIAVPVFNSAKANAQKRSCQASQRTLEGAYQTWQADNPDVDKSGFAAIAAIQAGGAAALAPAYVKDFPVCNAGGTYTATFSANGNAMTIECDITTPDHDAP